MANPGSGGSWLVDAIAGMEGQYVGGAWKRKHPCPGEACCPVCVEIDGHHRHLKRARSDDLSPQTRSDAHVQHGWPSQGIQRLSPMDQPIRLQHQAFIVIREHSHTPDPPASGFSTPAACDMERTESGLSISSDTSRHSHEDEQDGFFKHPLLSDAAAAQLVQEHVSTFRRRFPDSKHGRILRSLVRPRSRDADFPLDNDALRSIFSAANELFFANKLSQRVAWDWSHETSQKYESHIVGTTALRRNARLRGYETLIVLSSPILKDTKYNRRLLIATFLHEMIHSFLFVTCGLKARDCGGHTEGFRRIAEIIDDWVGREYLHLSDMEADLERFRGDRYEEVDAPIDQRPPSPPFIKLNGPSHQLDTQYSQGSGHDERHLYSQRAHPWMEISHEHSQQDDWQWYEREGFRTPHAHANAGGPYVY